MLPFIIAELGSNYHSPDDLLSAPALAKKTGADAIKYQIFSHHDMYGYGEKTPNIGYELIPRIAEACKYAGIEFMCTAFSFESLDVIDPYVSRHKVASSDVTWVEFLRYVGKLGKPVIVSSGGADETILRDAMGAVGPEVHRTILYCESVYPATHHDLRAMLRIGWLGVAEAVGWSDHTTDVYCAPLWAVSLGAKVIEKHYNPFGYTDTPDSPHSLSQDDFERMVLAMGGVEFQMTDISERGFRQTAQRRIVATRHIDVGDEFVWDGNIGAYRTKEEMDGLLPCEKDKIVGKVSDKTCEPGETITI